MREIKFRAWLKEEKKMVNVKDINFERSYIGVEIGINYYYYYFEDIELMQFTGLYDKNGKEIYEGDIVVADLYDIPNKKTGYIKYHEDTCVFLLTNFVFGYETWTSNREIKVIGNKYENEDLFEKVK